MLTLYNLLILLNSEKFSIIIEFSIFRQANGFLFVEFTLVFYEIIFQVMIALRAHKQIANYPVRMQKLIAQYGFLECFEEKRCIVKQGHPPQAFYYIFYGSGLDVH